MKLLDIYVWVPLKQLVFGRKLQRRKAGVRVLSILNITVSLWLISGPGLIAPTVVGGFLFAWALYAWIRAEQDYTQ